MGARCGKIVSRPNTDPVSSLCRARTPFHSLHARGILSGAPESRDSLPPPPMHHHPHRPGVSLRSGDPTESVEQMFIIVKMLFYFVPFRTRLDPSPAVYLSLSRSLFAPYP